jgi:hypothetical protein
MSRPTAHFTSCERFGEGHALPHKARRNILHECGMTPARGYDLLNLRYAGFSQMRYQPWYPTATICYGLVTK